MAPDLDNHTPFSALAFSQFHRDGTDMAVLAVRGSFHLVPGQPLALAPRQAALELADRYDGDPADGLLVRCCDLVPHKPAADLTILGTGWAPRGEAAASWLVGARLGRLEKLVRVNGPRRWCPVRRDPPEDGEKRDADWTLSAPQPARAVPLAWREAFGGPVPGSAPPDVHRANPLGRGIVDAAHCDAAAEWPAPAIEDPADPIADWRRHDHVPQGFAPLPPVWRPRQRHAGRYDDDWLARKHPLLPDDFDYRFYQYAAPGLVHEAPLAGDEELQLLHMHPDHAHVQVWLPGVRLSTTVQREDGKSESVPLMLDGVHVDLRGGLAQVFLTWRCWVPKREGVAHMALHAVDPDALLAAASRSARHEPLTGY